MNERTPIYTPINDSNRDCIKTIIRWLIQTVVSDGGDGDGVWYVRYYSIVDIHKLIVDNQMLPHGWKIEIENGDILMGDNQEWLQITNCHPPENIHPFCGLMLVW